jgi:hypothetical protein
MKVVTAQATTAVIAMAMVVGGGVSEAARGAARLILGRD